MDGYMDMDYPSEEEGTIIEIQNWIEDLQASVAASGFQRSAVFSTESFYDKMERWRKLGMPPPSHIEVQAYIDIGGDKDKEVVTIAGTSGAVKKAYCLLQEIREQGQVTRIINRSIAGARSPWYGFQFIHHESLATIDIGGVNDQDEGLITLSGDVKVVKKARYLLEQEISGKIGFQGGIRCYKCDQVGHSARECREEEEDLCYKCHGTEHIAQELQPEGGHLLK